MAKQKTRSAGFEDTNTSPVEYVPAGQKYLLGIGIDKYRYWPALGNAVRDMEDIVTVLTGRYDFEATKTTIIRNEEANRDRIEEELYQFTNTTKLKENDYLFIYYSGHGYLDGNEKGYWVPVDAQKGRISSYLPNSRIREIISDMKCRHVLLISDSCYSGSLFPASRGSDGDLLVATEYEKRASRWAFCSGRADQKVSDGSDGNSPFAKAFIQELRLNNAPKIHLSRIAEQVTAITRTNYDQLPNFGPIQGSGDMGGQFVFTLRDAKAQVPVATDPASEVDDRGGSSIPVFPPSTPPIVVEPPFLEGNAKKFAILYDVQDADRVTTLNKHLSVLKFTKKIAVYNVHQVKGGVNTMEAAEAAIVAADYVLSLISPNLFNNDAAWLGITLQALADGKKVIPILMDKVDIDGTGLEKLRSLPSLNRAVTDFPNPEAGFNDIVTEIKRLLQ